MALDTNLTDFQNSGPGREGLLNPGSTEKPTNSANSKPAAAIGENGIIIPPYPVTQPQQTSIDAVMVRPTLAPEKPIGQSQVSPAQPSAQATEPGQAALHPNQQSLEDGADIVFGAGSTGILAVETSSSLQQNNFQHQASLPLFDAAMDPLTLELLTAGDWLVFTNFIPAAN